MKRSHPITTFDVCQLPPMEVSLTNRIHIKEPVLTQTAAGSVTAGVTAGRQGILKDRLIRDSCGVPGNVFYQNSHPLSSRGLKELINQRLRKSMQIGITSTESSIEMTCSGDMELTNNLQQDISLTGKHLENRQAARRTSIVVNGRSCKRGASVGELKATKNRSNEAINVQSPRYNNKSNDQTIDDLRPVDTDNEFLLRDGLQTDDFRYGKQRFCHKMEGSTGGMGRENRAYMDERTTPIRCDFSKPHVLTNRMVSEPFPRSCKNSTNPLVVSRCYKNRSLLESGLGDSIDLGSSTDLGGSIDHCGSIDIGGSIDLDGSTDLGDSTDELCKFFPAPTSMGLQTTFIHSDRNENSISGRKFKVRVIRKGPPKPSKPQTTHTGLHFMRFSASRKLAAAIITKKKKEENALAQEQSFAEYNRRIRTRLKIQEANLQWNTYEEKPDSPKPRYRVRFARTATLRVIMEEKVTLFSRLRACLKKIHCIRGISQGQNDGEPIMEEFQLKTS